MNPHQVTASAQRRISTPSLVRRWIGIGIALAGAAVLGARGVQGFIDDDPRLSGAPYGGLVAALASTRGTSPLVQRTCDTTSRQLPTPAHR